eukprot:10521017-Lingulodinium_polyedra.AAC.1
MARAMEGHRVSGTQATQGGRNDTSAYWLRGAHTQFPQASGNDPAYAGAAFLHCTSRRHRHYWIGWANPNGTCLVYVMPGCHVIGNDAESGGDVDTNTSRYNRLAQLEFAVWRLVE